MTGKSGGVVVVGLAGGIASGKTLVAEMLGRLGALVLDADRINHCLLYTSPSPRDLSTSRMPSSA